MMRCLCLSGGEGHGAYQVGVLKRLTEMGRSWDLIAGVSVGALNGTLMAMYPPAQHKLAAQELEVFWSRILGNPSVYKRWFPFGVLSALWKGGAYNTAPLRRLVETTFDSKKLAASGVKLRIGAVALGKSDYHYVTETASRLPDWIMASAACPIIFPPVEIDGDRLEDGGVRDVTPVSDVLAEHPDEIDVILTGPLDKDPPPMDPKKFKNVLQVGMRTVAIMSDEIFKNDLQKVPEKDRPKLHVYAPKDHLPYEAFDFNPAYLKMAIQLGYDEAGAVCV